MAKPDWEAIESAYRAGSLSIRAIGEKHGVNHATILKRAGKEGWQRDLTEQVRTATKAKVTKSVTKSNKKVTKSRKKVTKSKTLTFDLDTLTLT